MNSLILSTCFLALVHGEKVFPFIGDYAWVGHHVNSSEDTSSSLINIAGVRGLMKVKQLVYLEDALIRRGMESLPGYPEHTHQSLQMGSPYSYFLTRGALSQLEATKHSADDINFSSDYIASFYDTVLDFTCYPRNMTCDSTIYRTMDGSCNNLVNPLWGMADTPLERLLPAVYEDGMWVPRMSSSEGPLPSPRLVSLVLTTGSHFPSQAVNQLFVGFAHFISHDLALVPTYKMKNSKTLSCCTPDGHYLDSHSSHEACFPIRVPEDDPFYEGHSVNCMNFVRSSIAPKLSCMLGYAEQLNSVSHFLDASPIYGLRSSNDVRAYKFGMLKVQSLGYEDYLPLQLNLEEECGDPLKARFCFQSGDRRTNQFVMSTVFYTLFSREHNRVARMLAKVNNHWDDEKIFQESRRIIIAVLQHVTYSEFLPAMLNEDVMKNYALAPQLDSYYTKYDSSVNPSVSNGFATAAFRFFHSMIPSTIHQSNDTGSTIGGSSVHYHINNPDVFYHPGGMDHLIRGSSENNAESCDVNIVYELKNRLYQKSSQWGLDLMALDIQRSRDHGLPSYSAYRRLCSGAEVANWSHLTNIQDDTKELLKHLYGSVTNIDPLVGMLAEDPKIGSIVGETLGCIIADQFLRLKKGDRFYYENAGEQSFSQSQLREIKKSSVAGLICANTGSITSVPEKSFLMTTRSNLHYPCHKIQTPNLLLWKEAMPPVNAHGKRFY